MKNFRFKIKLFSAVLVTTLMIFRSVNVYAQRQWNEIPKPEGASIMKIVKTSNGIIYAATNSFKIYRSADGGNSWTEINTSGAFMGNLRDIEVSSAGTLFTAAQHEGLAWTTNAGQTWNRNTLEVDPQGQGASPGGIGVNSHGIVFASELNFVWRSAQGMTSFSKLPVQGLGDFINYIGVDPADNVWLATMQGIFFSSNNGAQWSTRHDGLGAAAVFNFYFESKKVIYATTLNGIYKTTNEGEQWAQINGDVLTGDLKSDGEGTMYAITNNGVLASANNGVTWTAKNSGLSDSLLSSILPLQDKKVLCGTLRGGIFLTVNEGANWKSSSSGMTLDNISSFIPVPGGVLAATEVGPFKFNKADQKWKFSGKSLPSIYIDHLIRTREDDLFAAGLSGGGLFKSVDEGSSWVRSDNGLQGQLIRGIARDNRNIYVAAESLEGFTTNLSVSMSDDQGETWRLLHSEADFIQSGIGVSPEGDIYVYGADGNVEPKIISSTNGGANWNTLQLPFAGNVTSMVSIPNTNHMYYISGMGVFKTTNRGTNWVELNTSGVPNSIVCINVDEAGAIYLGTLEGMFVSANNGTSWAQTNVDGTLVRQIGFGENDLIYVRTNEGLYYMDKTVSVTPLSGTVKGFELMQNYPNPFNPATVISFRTAKSSFVSLNVYDVNGKMISSLVNEKKPAGSYSVKFDGSKLSSGIYFYTLTADNSVETRRMILIK